MAGAFPVESSFGFTGAELGQGEQRQIQGADGDARDYTQGMTEIFKGRSQPTGEQVLVMLELMKARR